VDTTEAMSIDYFVKAVSFFTFNIILTRTHH
jgi:hypothetical protein